MSNFASSEVTSLPYATNCYLAEMVSNEINAENFALLLVLMQQKEFGIVEIPQGFLTITNTMYTNLQQAGAFRRLHVRLNYPAFAKHFIATAHVLWANNRALHCLQQSNLIDFIGMDSPSIVKFFTDIEKRNIDNIISVFREHGNENWVKNSFFKLRMTWLKQIGLQFLPIFFVLLVTVVFLARYLFLQSTPQVNYILWGWWQFFREIVATF